MGNISEQVRAQVTRGVTLRKLQLYISAGLGGDHGNGNWNYKKPESAGVMDKTSCTTVKPLSFLCLAMELRHLFLCIMMDILAVNCKLAFFFFFFKVLYLIYRCIGVR